MNEELETRLTAVTGAAAFEKRGTELWMDAPALDVPTAASLLLEHGARLSTMTAIALEDGETEVIYHYAKASWACHLRTRTVGNRLPSITPVTPAADWIEREIMDLYAVTFTGHPNSVRLLRPIQLNPGYYRELGGKARR